VTRGLRLPSGRVIAIGRYMLASLFLLAIWMDVSQPANAPILSWGVLGSYVIFALVVLAITWKNWWLDARLAGAVHSIDIVVYTFLVFSTEGYTSPFFTAFMFILLAAAIRWGWRATALTAILLTLLYLLAGLAVAATTSKFVLQPFIIRTGHLIILSLILMWFGVNQWRSGRYVRERQAFDEPSLDGSLLQNSLAGAMDTINAARGILVWREHGSDKVQTLVADGPDVITAELQADALVERFERPFLYDVVKDRALAHDQGRDVRRFGALQMIRQDAAAALSLREGIAVPVSTAAGDGELFLESVPNLSQDHIDVGQQIAADIAAYIQRHALISAVEESAEARSRVALAGDLHDSVVQFLAGAAFRVEALKRDQAMGRNLEADLEQLKRLMLQEQGELRTFIAALRSGPQIELADLAKKLKELAAKLSRQWDVSCQFSAERSTAKVPSRLQFDTEQLIREAVANAVRHAGATSITIKLRTKADDLLLDMINDGSRFPKAPATDAMPRSLSERVRLAGGALELSRGLGLTKISVSLPLSGRAH
jgi:signal transduction histidine kinase